MSTPVMFDEPGPRGRRRNRILEVLTIAASTLAIALIMRRLSSHGFFDASAWQPFAQSGVWRLLGRGLRNNISAAGVAMLLSIAIGIALAAGLMSRGRSIRSLCAVTTAVFNSIPVILLLFFSSLTLPTWGIDLPDFWFLVIALTAYSGVVIGDLLAAGMRALPRGQSEAAAALGFSPLRTTATILLPQAIRRMTPALVSQMVIVFKGTALAYVLGGYLELLHTTTILGAYYSQSSLQALMVAAIMFMLVNIGLSEIARALERRGSGPRTRRSRRLGLN